MSLVAPGRPEAPATAVPAASRATVVASLAAHAIGAVALVVVPLFAEVRLPAPSRPIEAYIKAVSVARVPAPLPPGQPSPRPTPAHSSAAPSAAPPVAAPTEAPTTIGSGEPPSGPAPGVAVGGVPHSGLGNATGGLPAPPVLAPPPPPPPVTRPLRVGGDIRAPRKLHHVAPIYPPIAAQARVSGTVMLDATISPSGEVVDVRILRSVPLLDAAAVTAVRQWRYDPPRLNGTAVAVLLTVTVQFAQ
jgi:protein TonB